MKQLLLATAAVVGLSSAALAAEPVALTDSQLDNVTAGQPTAVTFPIAAGTGTVTAGFLAVVIGPSGVAASPTALTF